MKYPFFVIAHNIRSAHNVGSIFRTADAFGVTKIFLTGYTPHPADPSIGPKIAKTALGGEKYVAWESSARVGNLVKRIKKEYPTLALIGLENNVESIPLKNFRPKGPIALLLGEEVKGIKKDLLKQCDVVVEIPMVGKKESLNVSVAFGIAAYSLTL